VHATLDTAGEHTGHEVEPLSQNIREDADALNQTLAGKPTPNALFLFPAGLTAGADTDVHRILGLAGLDNAAAKAGLDGYQQITTEAVQRVGVDYVVATGTMRATPTQIAERPMFEDTRVENAPDRVLVVDPSRTSRLGPHAADAAGWLAQATHPSLDGPELSPTIEPSEANACETVNVSVNASNARVTLAGQTHTPGEIRVPEVPEGHYRVTIEAGTPPATFETLVTVEGSACEN
jgi:iron complex transport system substrate-binding protein